jgi:hypothetical protein
MREPIDLLSQPAVADGLAHRQAPALMLAAAAAAGPSRRVIAERPSGPSSLSASLRPRSGLAGLTGPLGRRGSALT